ncbi:MAG: hypothetical protein CMG63_04770 [Candidatus Marinimicrobia bacterium]|nr:hypothetical protein [Candidatus Neomarinimicrobiota bacterium]
MNQPIKILHIINHLGNGGAEKNLYNLCRIDNYNYHFVLVLIPGGVYFKPVTEITSGTLSINIKKKRIKHVLKVIKEIRAISPDIIQTWLYHSDLFGVLLCKLIKKPLVWSVRNNKLYNNTDHVLTIAIRKLLSFLSMKYPTYILYNSIEAKVEHEKKGYDKRKGLIVSNILLMPKVMCKQNSFQGLKKEDFKNKTIFGMVARAHKIKGHHDLLLSFKNALRTCDDIHLCLIGNGISDSEIILNYINDFGIKSNVTLFAETDRIFEFYEFIDVHILTSLSESHPNVVIESMAIGVPNISTDVGNAKKIINELGVIVKKRDVSSIKKAILKMHNDRKFNETSWKSLGDKCKKQIQSTYDNDITLDYYNKIWRKKVKVLN